MSGDDIVVPARDFGRLEGKVDSIVTDVGELKEAVSGYNTRIIKLEVSQAQLDATAKANRADIDASFQKEGISLSKQQTVILIAGFVLAVVVAAVGWVAMIH